MGWAEEHANTTPPADERMAADALARSVAAFMKHGSTGNVERMGAALDRYRSART